MTMVQPNFHMLLVLHLVTCTYLLQLVKGGIWDIGIDIKVRELFGGG